MKDIIITSKRLNKEIRILLTCFIVSFILNILSIIIYKTPWVEMFSQIGYVVVISFILFLIVTFIRLLVWTIGVLFRKKRKV